MSTTKSTSLYVPESIKTPCMLIASWDGVTTKPPSSETASQANVGNNSSNESSPSDNPARGRYFKLSTKVYNDYWKRESSTSIPLGRPWRTVRLSGESESEALMTGTNSLLVVEDDEGLKTVLTSTWRPPVGKWVLAPQSCMVREASDTREGDASIEETIERGIKLKTGLEDTTKLSDLGSHAVHPGIENTIRHNFIHYKKFDGVLAPDGSNLPLTIPVRKGAVEGDGRPMKEWETVVCPLTDLSSLVSAYQSGEHSTVDAFLGTNHPWMSMGGETWINTLKERINPESTRQADSGSVSVAVM